MATRKTLMTKPTASGAQQYTSERMKDEGSEGFKATIMRAARKKADSIGGAKGEAFLSFVRAADYAASSGTSITDSVKEMYDSFEKRWTARGRSYARKAKGGGGGK